MAIGWHRVSISGALFTTAENFFESWLFVLFTATLLLEHRSLTHFTCKIHKWQKTMPPPRDEAVPCEAKFGGGGRLKCLYSIHFPLCLAYKKIACLWELQEKFFWIFLLASKTFLEHVGPWQRTNLFAHSERARSMKWLSFFCNQHVAMGEVSRHRVRTALLLHGPQSHFDGEVACLTRANVINKANFALSREL